MSRPRTTLPKGSWVLVTGITGFIASHVAKQFLERGYKVRGTVRDLARASWVRDDLFKDYADENLELVVVSDIGLENAFDDAVKGMSAVIHLATVTDLNPDPNEAVPRTVSGAVSILNAALKESLVQEVVYTSSYSAAAMALPGTNTHVERDTWNEMAVQLAWSPPPHDPSHGFVVYVASKVAAEKEVWKFVSEKQPKFTVNVISPSAVLGQPLNKVHTETNGAWLRLVLGGQVDIMSKLNQTYWVDVKDVALLHVASVLDPEVKSSRLQTWGIPGGWNDVIAVMRRLRPDQAFMADIEYINPGTLSTDSEPALALLKKWGHQDGWRSLEQMVAETLSSYPLIH